MLEFVHFLAYLRKCAASKRAHTRTLKKKALLGHPVPVSRAFWRRERGLRLRQRLRLRQIVSNILALYLLLLLARVLRGTKEGICRKHHNKSTPILCVPTNLQPTIPYPKEGWGPFLCTTNAMCACENILVVRGLSLCCRPSCASPEPAPDVLGYMHRVYLQNDLRLRDAVRDGTIISRARQPRNRCA